VKLSSASLTGGNILPVKFAEAFGFGRAKKIKRWPTGTSNLVLSSPDGESGRPVGKAECLGDPKGKLVGRRSFGYFSSAFGRKVTRHQGETKS
jgi:hypothetical protein